MVTARTFSGPSARAARNVTTLESIPPERPDHGAAEARAADLRADEPREDRGHQLGIDGEVGAGWFLRHFTPRIGH